MNDQEPRYVETQAYADLQSARAAMHRMVTTSGNKKLRAHWRVISAYIDVSSVLMKRADFDQIRDAATIAEIRSLLPQDPPCT